MTHFIISMTKKPHFFQKEFQEVTTHLYFKVISFISLKFINVNDQDSGVRYICSVA